MGRRFQDEREQRRLTHSWWWHEDRFARRLSNRRVRHKAKALLHKGDVETLPKPPRTMGRMTN